MATKIQIRQDTAANWTSLNPLLDVGELGYETDTYRLKIGQGTGWNSIGYFGEGEGANVIGPLTSLNTTDKTYIVNAINEVLGIASGSKTASDTNTQTLNAHATTLQELDAAILQNSVDIEALKTAVAAMQLLLNGDDLEYDSILELANKLKAVEAIVAGIDPATAIALYNGLGQLNTGTALDAVQGKVLNDALSTLSQRVEAFISTGGGSVNTSDGRWLTRPLLELSGNQVLIKNVEPNVPLASWPSGNEVYPITPIPYTFPNASAGKAHAYAIVGNVFGDFEVEPGVESDKPVLPAILDNRLLAGYVIMGEGSGSVVMPDMNGYVTQEQLTAALNNVLRTSDIAPDTTDASNSKLATIGQVKALAVTGTGSSETATTIKTKYESNADTNAFTDAEKTKLGSLTQYTDNQAKDAAGAAVVAGTPGSTYDSVNKTITIPTGSGTFPGYVTETFSATPYTTLQPTAPNMITIVVWGGRVQLPVDYSSTQVGDKVRINGTPSEVSGDEGVIRYVVLAGAGGGGGTDPEVNAAPTALAGSDQTTTEGSSITLSGSGTDSDGTISSYAWAQAIGPNTATFSSTLVAQPTVSNLVAGTYTFRLTVTDNEGATATDDVTVTVNSVSNTTPSAPLVRSDDSGDTLSFLHELGNLALSTNGGAYVAYTAGTVINIEDVARAAGYYKCKRLASSGYDESPVAESPAFTAATVNLPFLANFTGASGTAISAYTPDSGTIQSHAGTITLNGSGGAAFSTGSHIRVANPTTANLRITVDQVSLAGGTVFAIFVKGIKLQVNTPGSGNTAQMFITNTATYTQVAQTASAFTQTARVITVEVIGDVFSISMDGTTISATVAGKSGRPVKLECEAGSLVADSISIEQLP